MSSGHLEWNFDNHVLFFQNPTFWLKIWKQELILFRNNTVSPQKKIAGLYRNFVFFSGNVSIIAQDFSVKIKKFSKRFFFKSYLPRKSSPGHIKCILDSSAKKFRAKGYLSFHQHPKKSLPLGLFPKKMFTKISAGYVKSKPDNPSKKLPKVNTFFSKPNAFLKIPLSGRKQHYSSRIPMDTRNAVLTKSGMFSAESPKTNTKSTIFLQMFVFVQKFLFWANVAVFCRPAEKLFAKVEVFPLKFRK